MTNEYWRQKLVINRNSNSETIDTGTPSTEIFDIKIFYRQIPFIIEEKKGIQYQETIHINTPHVFSSIASVFLLYQICIKNTETYPMLL